MNDAQTIALANERLSIIVAATEAGVEVSDFSIGSVKLYCPFGDLFHLDGGMAKAFRIYPMTNSAYCFACQAYYSPVHLVALARDLTDIDAAQIILQETGYVPPDYVSQLEALEREAVKIDRDGLAEALKVACARMDPNWEERQFEDEIAQTLRKCLSLLPQVASSEDATQWLSVCKKVMSRALGAARV